MYLIITQSVQQVQMSPKLLVNDYFDIIEYHKGDKIQQYDTSVCGTTTENNGKSRLSRIL